MTRVTEHQEDSAASLQALQSEAIALKKEAIENRHEEAANRCLCLEFVAGAVEFELQMWLCLKEDKMEEAWDLLVEAETSIRSAMRAHDRTSRFDNYPDRLHTIEKTVFPPQIFASIGGYIIKSRCSVCGNLYSDCPHVKGQPYMGRMCIREITEFEVEEGSLVDDPSNKHCRVVKFTDHKGMQRNWMTWKKTNDKEDHEVAIGSIQMT